LITQIRAKPLQAGGNPVRSADSGEIDGVQPAPRRLFGQT
jgi:hypothetical protein